MPTLYYYHDPMCSWCWAYRPTATLLFASLPQQVSRVNILGGLAPDSSEPMPPALQETIAGYWQRIHDTLGTEFNFDFWSRCEPRRSTYAACRAVIAATRQGSEEAMTGAIQQAYYLRAMNPSDTDTLETLAGELGLDSRQFASDLRSRDVDLELSRQIEFARQSPISGFPSLALDHGGHLQPITQDYEDHEVSLQEIERLTENTLRSR